MLLSHTLVKSSMPPLGQTHHSCYDTFGQDEPHKLAALRFLCDVPRGLDSHMTGKRQDTSEIMLVVKAHNVEGEKQLDYIDLH